jgi:hypothetical protein
VQEINGPGEWPVLFFGDAFYRDVGFRRVVNRSKTARRQWRGGNRFANP